MAGLRQAGCGAVRQPDRQWAGQPWQQSTQQRSQAVNQPAAQPPLQLQRTYEIEVGAQAINGGPVEIEAPPVVPQCVV